MNRANFVTRFSLLLAALIPGVAAAHPAHTSFAEVEWNERTERVEVAYQVGAYHLEQALRTHHGSAVDLDKTADLESLLKQYFAEHFYLAAKPTSAGSGAADAADAAAGERDNFEAASTMHWVGQEHDERTAWVYFELSIEGELDGMQLVNRVLLDTLEQQSNLVELGMGPRMLTLQFDATRPVQTIRKSKAGLRFQRAGRRGRPGHTH